MLEGCLPVYTNIAAQERLGYSEEENYCDGSFTLLKISCFRRILISIEEKLSLLIKTLKKKEILEFESHVKKQRWSGTALEIY